MAAKKRKKMGSKRTRITPQQAARRAFGLLVALNVENGCSAVQAVRSAENNVLVRKNSNSNVADYLPLHLMNQLES